MPKYFLRPDVYFCAVGHNVVFLDLATHKYLGLDCNSTPPVVESLAAAETSTQRALTIDALGECEAATALNALLEKGILSEVPDHNGITHRANCRPARSMVSSPPVTRETLPVVAVARFIASFIFVRLHLRFFGLKSFVRRFRSIHDVGVVDVTPYQLDEAARIVRAFCRIRSWIYTAHDQCLMDSLVLTEFMQRYGFPADFVIAVHPMPFSAHAWVQLGDCVLDETVETVRRYSPILVA